MHLASTPPWYAFNANIFLTGENPMQRRHFCTQTALLAASSMLITPGPTLAQTGTPQAGKDYVKLDQPVPVQAPAGKIEVIEFFGYFCPHCNAFEPAISSWAKQLPKDLVFKRVPVAFSDSSVPQQRLFYALEAMGLLDQLHAKVFEAIHVHKLNLTQGDAITDWVIKQGVDKDLFNKHFSSFTGATQVSRAKQLTAAYQVDGVPALGIAGRFYTDGALTGSMDRVLRVVDFLIAQVRAGR
jgi:thiol:disulfide interchange protein DsbA